MNYKFKNTYFEIILVCINDLLVKKYLENKISYISIHQYMLKLLRKSYFKRYYTIKPKNIHEVKHMISNVNEIVEKYLSLNYDNK